jgi:plasmid stability protein
MSKKSRNRRGAGSKAASDLLVINIAEEEIALLQVRAKRHGRTLDEEVHQILRDAVSGKK